MYILAQILNTRPVDLHIFRSSVVLDRVGWTWSQWQTHKYCAIVPTWVTENSLSHRLKERYGSCRGEKKEEDFQPRGIKFLWSRMDHPWRSCVQPCTAIDSGASCTSEYVQGGGECLLSSVHVLSYNVTNTRVQKSGWHCLANVLGIWRKKHPHAWVGSERTWWAGSPLKVLEIRVGLD